MCSLFLLCVHRYTQTEFVPFNPTDKRTEATINTPDGKVKRVIKGAPQVILRMSANKDEVADQVNACVINLANRGYRPLAVAVTNDDGDMIMQGTNCLRVLLSCVASSTCSFSLYDEFGTHEPCRYAFSVRPAP